MTMIECDSVPGDVPRVSDCGISLAGAGTPLSSRPRRLGERLPRKVKKKIKTKIRRTRSVSLSSLCAMTGLEQFCQSRSSR